MNRHGNLYWDIGFYALCDGTKGLCEDTRITVQGHDFKEVYERAAALYEAVVQHGAKRVFCANVYLRDDGSLNKARLGDIYVAHRIFEKNVDAFFRAGAENAFKHTYI